MEHRDHKPPGMQTARCPHCMAALRDTVECPPSSGGPREITTHLCGTTYITQTIAAYVIGECRKHGIVRTHRIGRMTA